MKRNAPQPHPGKRHSLALMNFSKNQLAGIGAVAVTFNAVEELIDDLVRIGWRLTFDPKQILTRINGVDHKIELIKHAAEVWGMPSDIKQALETIFGEADFKRLKRYRDGVIHARLWDAKTAVGVHVGFKNKRVEVLLSEQALNGLAARFEVMWLELRALKESYLAARNKALEESDLEKAQLEEEYQETMIQYRSYRTQRLSLPPLPEFPEPPTSSELLEGLLEGRSDQPTPSA